MKCDLCPDKHCEEGKDCWKAKGDVLKMYSSSEDQRMMRIAAAIEGTYYMEKTRVEELIIFGEEMGYKRLGVAFCLGLQQEAQVLCSLLRKHFTVSSICCKVCGVAKEDFGLKKVEKNKYEVMCNPIMQAEILAKNNTELNIIVGLCLGHDILFTKYSKAPVTTLIVKDRVLAHNPAGALYSRFYSRELANKKEIEEVNYD
jgi:uncharacterized metal-binding protein